MSQGGGPVKRLTQPERTWAQRFAVAMLVVLAFALMLLGKADIVLVERTRTMVTDALTPVLEAVSRPAVAVSDAVGDVEAMLTVHEENERLRARNAALLKWEERARSLAAENAELRRLLRFAPEPAIGYTAARVIADPGGTFVHSILVNAGRNQNVRKDQAAITARGLVGRVVEVGGRSSRILLVTDLNSRIPVLIEPGRWRAVLAGDNTEQPRLLYLSENAKVGPGDRVVTSGHGGVFPPGLPIGRIDSVAEAAVRVALNDTQERLEFVRIVDFGMESVLDVDAEPQVPTQSAAGDPVAPPARENVARGGDGGGNGAPR